MSIKIGLTGPTGSGKSSAAKLAEKHGFQVIDCDLMARKAVEKGTKGLEALCKAFGDDILKPDGTLNRKRLAEKAFCSKDKTELLNQTLLPYIVEISLNNINSDKLLFDAPTLFESGMDKQCDFTVAVLAERDIRLKRITERDRIDNDAAVLRINAGKDDDFYKQNADYIIYNNGDISAFEKEFLNLLRR